jgi:2-deoxy-D-gluconate 3-dehydrogenase
MTIQNIAEIFDLTGKVAIVTGGAMGIGEAIASRLAEAGANVIIADIDLKAARQTAAKIEAGGGKARAIHANVANPADAANMVQATIEAFGGVDIIVNNAGVFPSAAAVELREGIWDKVIDTNLKGVFFCSQAAAREMIKAKHGGKIINITSTGAKHPMVVDQAHYNASKGGILSLTISLAREFAPHDILVNAVAPGAVMTAGGLANYAADLEARGELVDEQAKRVLDRIPLRRIGEPDDIAKVVLFVASRAADYMTGSLIVVDGGFLVS